jgi:hypothetical protein
MAKKISIENFLKMTPQVPQFSDRNQHYLTSGVHPLYYLEDGTQEEQAAPLAASVDWSQISMKVISSFSESNQNTDVKLGDGTFTNVGQTFTTTDSITLKSVKFYIKKVEGTPGFFTTQSLNVYLFATTGTPPTAVPTGSHLAITNNSITIVGEVGTSYSLVEFTFGTPPTLSASTQYAVVVQYSGSGNATNYVTIGSASGGGAAGNSVTSTNTGASWSASSTDSCFYVSGGGVVSTLLDGNVTHMVPSTNSTYAGYMVTDTSKVYGFNTTTVTDLGYPSGSAVSANIGFQLAIAGGTTTTGNLFLTYPLSASVYKMPLASGAWTTTAGTLGASLGIHQMEPFLDFVAVGDAVSGGTFMSLIKKLNVTSYAISTGIDLGAGFGLLRMRNLNNKYLAIAAGKSSGATITIGYPQNYIFLWDGISSRYNYAIKVPGQFIDMKVIDSVLKVAVKVSNNKTCVYSLSGTRLVKDLTTQISAILSSPVYSAFQCSVFDFRNYTGLHLNDFSTLTDPILVYGKDESGDIEFIHSSGRDFDQIITGYDGNLYANQYNLNSSSVLFYLPTTGTTYQNILYLSQWIPVKNLSAIDIYYENPPQSGTDQINVVIYGQGEDIITGSSTTTTANINPSNYLTAKRSRLDLEGFVGDMIKVQLSTTNSTWKPIIRAISLIQR